jgi:hypothetical protein
MTKLYGVALKLGVLVGCVDRPLLWILGPAQ